MFMGREREREKEREIVAKDGDIYIIASIHNQA